MRRLLSLTLWFAACGPAGADGEAITVTDSSGVAIVMNDLTRLDRTCTIGTEPSLSIGEEEGDDPYVLTRLGGAVRLSDGRIVIAARQSHEIRYFDANGRHLYSAGRRGEGPGEFTDPWYFSVLPGDTLYVGNESPFFYLVFSPEGKWVRRVMPDPLEANSPTARGVLRDGRLVLGSTITRSWPVDQFTSDTVFIRGYDATGRVVDTLGRFPTARYATVVPGSNFYTFPLFESFAQFAIADQHVITGHASRTELQVRRAAPGYPLERVIRWNVGDRSIPPGELAFEQERLRAQYARIRGQFREIIEQTEAKRPIADELPAFGQLRFGRDGRVWIREFPLPTDTTAHHWIAFGADGRFDCRLDTRRFAEYYEFGADYMLVQDVDSLDVERVRVYPLQKP